MLTSGPQHSLPEDQVDIPRLADAETYPQIHLRTHCALPHSLLRRPLRSRDKSNRDRAAKPRDGIGVAHRVRRFVGQLGVFIDNDYERGPSRGISPRYAFLLQRAMRRALPAPRPRYEVG